MNNDVARAKPEQGTGVPTALRSTDFELAARLSRQSLDHDPGNADLLRLLILAQIGLGDVAEARATSERLEHAPRTPATLDAILSAYLADNQVGCARDRVAEASGDPNMPAWAIEAARARIATHIGDAAAAQAILIRGIEREPDAPWLRGMLTELLVSLGRAGEARDFIDRLGKPPTTPDVFRTEAEPSARTGT